MGSTGTATVMFTDLVDSTGLRHRLGETAADDLRVVHDDLLRVAVEEAGGTLVKGLGDGIMATFAAASDGVAAAIAVQQGVDVHNRRSASERLSVRVGLSAGDVLFEGRDCFGSPVIEASRLCAAAEGGQILAADVVRALARTRAEAFRALGPMELRGLDHAVPVSEVRWEPLGLLPVVLGQAPLPSLLTSERQFGFTGRNDELTSALTHWKQALAGERQALLLSGEPGIGKTRLAGEVGAHAHAQGATVLYGRCEEDLGAPYQPFAEALDYLVGCAPPEQLKQHLGRYPEELVRLAPALRELLPDLPAPLRSDAETERYRLFEAVASWLTAAAELRGLVLVLDDLHWATRPTLLLLQHVLHATGDAKLLVVGTYRDTDLARTHPLGGLLADLRRSPGVERLALVGLDLEGVVELVTDAAGHQLDAEGQSLAVAVHAETEGNPFFVSEVLRHLRETGTIYLQDGKWVSDRTVAQLAIPEGVRDVVGRRLDRLSADANAALSVAAVIGRDFTLDLVTRAGALGEDAVVGGLEEASSARLVEETGVGTYRFAHALVRSTLYEELSATRRARMHATVGDRLEQTSPGDVVALAHHFAAASVVGDVAKAVDYSRRAGDQAMAQLAHDSAAVLYAQALELLPEDAEAGDLRRCEVLLQLGEAQRRSGDDRFRETLLEAAALAIAAGSSAYLTQAALANGRGFWSMAGQVDHERIAVLEQALQLEVGETADRARLLVRLANELMFTGDRVRREGLADQALDVARRAGDPLALADVLAELGPNSYTPWQVEEGGVLTAELLALAASVGDPYRLAIAHLWTFINGFFSARDPEPLIASLEAADKLGRDLAQPTLRWLTRVWQAVLTQMQGRTAEAMALAEEAWAIGQETGQPDAWAWYAGQLVTIARETGLGADFVEAIEAEVSNQPGIPVWEAVLCSALLEVGRVEESRSILRRLVDVPSGVVRLPQDIVWILGVAQLLGVAGELGETASTELLYAELLPFRHLTVNGGVTYHGSAEHHLGVAAASLGRLEQALEHLSAALGHHERLGARLYLGMSYAELSRVLRRRRQDGDVDRADAAEGLARSLADETGGVLILRGLTRVD